MLAYFQSQQSLLGNTINIADKNRYLTSNLLLQTEKYLDGTSNASELGDAVNGLQSNIITLKQGGMISGVDLKPLPSDFLDLWNIINENWVQRVCYPNKEKITDTPTRQNATSLDTVCTCQSCNHGIARDCLYTSITIDIISLNFLFLVLFFLLLITIIIIDIYFNSFFLVFREYLVIRKTTTRTFAYFFIVRELINHR